MHEFFVDRPTSSTTLIETVKAISQRMSKDTVPHRMKVAHPNEFNPKIIVFDFQTDKESNWKDCYYLKAAAVYSAIYGRNADGFKKAKMVLTCLANWCYEKKATAIMVEDVPNQREICNKADAIYLLLGFLKDFDNYGYDREKIDSYFMSRHGHHLVSDIAMIGNQVPLETINEVAQKLPEAVKETLHAKEEVAPTGYTGAPSIDVNLDQLLPLFCFYYSPVYVNKDKCNKRLPKQLKDNNLLKYLYDFVTETSEQRKVETQLVWPIPSVKELARSGVRFAADTSNAIRIKFEKTVLKLPALVFDSKLETIVQNLLAWEISEEKRPVTRFFQVMNELVDDVGDVRILKRFGIVRGRWKKDEDVVDFVKRINGFASYPSMDPSMEAEIGKMKEYHDDRMKKFLVKHGRALKWVTSAAAVSLVVTAMVAAAKRRD